MSTIVALSRNGAGDAVLQCTITPNTNAEEFPIPASALVLPSSPSEITPTWGPDVSPAAKELAWQLLDVFRQNGEWGTAEVTHMAMHMLVDTRRQGTARVGFKHYPMADELETFRRASRELADRGYVTRNPGNTTLSPTAKLVACVAN